MAGIRSIRRIISQNSTAYDQADEYTILVANFGKFSIKAYHVLNVEDSQVHRRVPK